jgi:hypothetical protein
LTIWARVIAFSVAWLQPFWALFARTSVGVSCLSIWARVIAFSVAWLQPCGTFVARASVGVSCFSVWAGFVAPAVARFGRAFRAHTRAIILKHERIKTCVVVVAPTLFALGV